MSDNLDGALCVGQHDLFDSTDRRDHLAAKGICMACPVRAACANLLDDLRQTGPQHVAHRPAGTWAGQLVGAMGGATPGQGALPREHGTDRGYQQHRRLKERACCDCLAAHASRAQGRKVAS